MQARAVSTAVFSNGNSMIKTNVLTLGRFDLAHSAIADHGAHIFEVTIFLPSVH
jgi:hypothetical protein